MFDLSLGHLNRVLKNSAHPKNLYKVECLKLSTQRCTCRANVSEQKAALYVQPASYRTNLPFQLNLVFSWGTRGAPAHVMERN